MIAGYGDDPLAGPGVQQGREDGRAPRADWLKAIGVR
jgi:hypothetical protein